MGNDPKTSVADAFNRAHDVPNLFIADSSSMPTSAGVNPSSTIQALALRCADHIWESRRDL
jgi:choline dehydrogenase-like flavoprotein